MAINIYMNPEPTQSTNTPITTPAVRPIWYDLLIPGSIVVAGLFIGVGLYFSGATGGMQPNVAVEPPAQPDNTQLVNEVTEADHIKGSLDSGIVIVEYSDYDCVFCGRFHNTMNDIVATNDDVAWVYRHSPIAQLHPQARAVAVAAECVAELAGNDAFWTFTDGYFAAREGGNDAPHAELIAQLATTAGVTQAPFAECFESERTDTLVQEDMDNAQATGGGGTPWSILIGPSGKTYPINGALPPASVERLIQIARDEA
jgi:protein-disulfide isomerase